MKCKVCNKNVLEHTKTQVLECLENAGFTEKYKSPYEAMGDVGLSVTVNWKKKLVIFRGEMIEAKDVDLVLYQVCLLGDKVKAPKKVELGEEEEEQWS